MNAIVEVYVQAFNNGVNSYRQASLIILECCNVLPGLIEVGVIPAVTIRSSNYALGVHGCVCCLYSVGQA